MPLLFREGPMTRKEAVVRERTLKKWSRKKKLAPIAKTSSQTYAKKGIVRGYEF